MHTLFHISSLKFIKLQVVLPNYLFSLYVINAHTVSYLYRVVYQATRSVAQLSVQFVCYQCTHCFISVSCSLSSHKECCTGILQFVRHQCTHCFISLSCSLSSYKECCSAIRSVCTSSMHTLFHISILKFINLQRVLLNYPFSL